MTNDIHAIPRHIVRWGAILQLASIVLWNTVSSLYAGGEAVFVGLIFGVLGLQLTVLWFRRMQNAGSFSWTTAFLWFPACAAVAFWRCHEEPTAHPAALAYGITSLALWILMWDPSVRPSLWGPWQAQADEGTQRSMRMKRLRPIAVLTALGIAALLIKRMMMLPPSPPFHAPTSESLEHVGHALNEYKAWNGHYPDRLRDMYACTASVQFLQDIPSTNRFVDGWGHRFIYTRRGDSYDLRSLGPDGHPSDDDIIELSREDERRQGELYKASRCDWETN